MVGPFPPIICLLIVIDVDDAGQVIIARHPVRSRFGVSSSLSITCMFGPEPKSTMKVVDIRCISIMRLSCCRLMFFKSCRSSLRFTISPICMNLESSPELWNPQQSLIRRYPGVGILTRWAIHSEEQHRVRNPIMLLMLATVYPAVRYWYGSSSGVGRCRGGTKDRRRRRVKMNGTGWNTSKSPSKPL